MALQAGLLAAEYAATEAIRCQERDKNKHPSQLAREV